MSRRKLEVAFTPVEGPELDRLSQSFPAYKAGTARGTPGGFFISTGYAERAEEVYNFQVREDDTWVVTFPKCGTTWMQELVWLVSNDCDFKRARSISLNHRFPFLEMSLLPPKELVEAMKGQMLSAGEIGLDWEDFIYPYEKIVSMPSPRFIKSHLPLYLLPPGLLDTAKVVYVARNPKDVIVSYYYHHKLFKPTDIPIDIETFAEHFLKDEIQCSPFFPHVLEAWNKRQHSNLLFVFYEDMKKDLRGQIKRVAHFLGKKISEEKFEILVQHLRFDSFFKNESVNMERGKTMGLLNAEGNFVRKGKTGDWKNHFGPEMNARIDRWIEKNLSGSDLTFVTELEKQD